MKDTILIIEDEQRIAHWMQTYLHQAGFHTLHAADGITGLDLARTAKPALIILDLMLPGMDGLGLCEVFRSTSAVPIMIVTARSGDEDRINGLEIGADDYISKPFNPRELVARVRAILRRTAPTGGSHPLTRGAISLQHEGHRCIVAGESVELSRIQFGILETLMRHANQTLSREQLLEAVFSGDYDGYDRSLDAHIRRLRQRIEPDSAKPSYIITVYGIGYKFVTD